MKFYDILLIGVALSMDALTITVANCSTYKKNLTRKKEWCMPIFFAVFQGLMPLTGYFIGSLFSQYFEKFSGFITSAIFLLLALKIVYDKVKELKEDETAEKKLGSLTYKTLLLQALATSIDAFAIGVTLASGIALNIYLAVTIIAVTTFIIVAVGLYVGKFFGKVFGDYAEWIGAVILFALAIKELILAIIKLC